MGCLIHTATQDEYMTITIQRSHDYNRALNPEQTSVRLNVGRRESALYYSFDMKLDTFVIRNVPIYANEEAWIAITNHEHYCAFGYAKKNPA